MFFSIFFLRFGVRFSQFTGCFSLSFYGTDKKPQVVFSQLVILMMSRIPKP